MWDFFLEIFRHTGVSGLACIFEAGVILVLIKAFRDKDKRVEESQQQLLSMSAKRLEDVIEDRTKYEELSQDLHKSIDLLIKVFRKKHDLNGD